MNAKKIPIIMDIEASGFGADSYPIEVGVVNHLGDRYCALIKPHTDWLHWSESAEQVHGISQELLKTKGKSVRQVCEELNDFLCSATVYSDAWTFDQSWLNRLYYAANMSRSFYLSPIENIASDEQLMVWDNTKIQLECSLNIQRHRASGDAYLIQQTYVKSFELMFSGSLQTALPTI